MVTVYLDASALVKLVVPETESRALRAHLAGSRAPRATSAIARVEVVRATAAVAPIAVATAREVLDEISEVVIDRDLLDRAAALEVGVRSLDAIHLASALRLGATLTELITYDRRMAVAADALGLPVSAPG
jgi:hypothetical protein